MRQKKRLIALSGAAGKVLYCFHKNNDDSKCEVAHRPLPIRPSKSPSVRQDGGWSQEGYMAPKPARFIFAVGMALTMLAVRTGMAAPSQSIYPIYQPQLLLLY